MSRNVEFNFEFGVNYPTEVRNLDEKRIELQKVIDSTASILDDKVRRILNVPESVVSSRQVNLTQIGV